MKKVFAVIVTVITMLLCVSCINGGTRPFQDLQADEIEYVTLNCTPPDKTVETDDEEKINELVKILKKVTIYEVDEKEYAGQSVGYTLHMKDGSETKFYAYNPQFVLDGIKYRTKYEPCEALSSMGNDWINEIPSSHKPLDEVKDILSKYPDDFHSVMDMDMFTIVHGVVDDGQEIYTAFVESVTNGRAAELVLVQFTAEGDPIYGYLSFNGDSFYYVEDSSRDTFGDKNNQYREYSFNYLMTGADDMGSYAFLTDNTEISTFTKLMEEYDSGIETNSKIIFEARGRNYETESSEFIEATEILDETIITEE